MRKSLWTIPVLLLFTAIGAPAAHADATYAISLTGANAPTIVGSNLISYDPTLGYFTTPSIEINFLGTNYSLNNLVGNYVGVSPTTDVLNWEFSPSGPDVSSAYTVAGLADASLGGAFIFQGTLPVPSGSGSAQLTPFGPIVNRYAISLTGANAPTIVGSNLISYDPTLGYFTTPSIEINFLGTNYSLNNLVGNYVGVSPKTDVLNWEFSPSGPDVSSGYTVAGLADASLGGAFIFQGTLPFPSGSGSAQLTPIQTPEPATGVLMFLGIGVVFVMKRIGQRLPRAT